MRELLDPCLKEVRARYPRHLLIGKSHIDVLAHEKPQGRGSGDGRQNLVRLAPQSALERIRDIGLVVDEKDGGVAAWFHFGTLARNSSATSRTHQRPSSSRGSSSPTRTRPTIAASAPSRARRPP